MAITQTIFAKEKIGAWEIETGTITTTTSTGVVKCSMKQPKHIDLSSYTEAEAFRVRYSQHGVNIACSNAANVATYRIYGLP